MNRLEQLRQYLANEPDSPFIKYAIGMEFLGQGEFPEAEHWFQRTMADHPDYIPVYYQLGKLIAITGTLTEARAVLSKGITLAEAQKESHAARELKQLLEELDDEA